MLLPMALNLKRPVNAGIPILAGYTGWPREVTAVTNLESSRDVIIS
jgi:hypothetical protein